jgi:hypothetical protein
MDIFNRATLKRFFERGKTPSEVHFANLIDSTINKIDDGFAKTVNDGLKISPMGESKKLISFFQNLNEKHSSWDFSINPSENAKGLSLAESEDKSRIFFQVGGQIGIGTTKPNYPLDVNGSVGMSSRIGTHIFNGEIIADAEWHILINDLIGCNMFEVVAKVEGVKQRGKYAFAHAIAVSTHESVNNKINVTQACYGWFWHRIKFRWRLNTNGSYRLEIKTLGHYGTDNNNQPIRIKCHITSLWDDGLDS